MKIPSELIWVVVLIVVWHVMSKHLNPKEGMVPALWDYDVYAGRRLLPYMSTPTMTATELPDHPWRKYLNSQNDKPSYEIGYGVDGQVLKFYDQEYQGVDNYDDEFSIRESFGSPPCNACKGNPAMSDKSLTKDLHDGFTPQKGFHVNGFEGLIDVRAAPRIEGAAGSTVASPVVTPAANPAAPITNYALLATNDGYNEFGNLHENYTDFRKLSPY